MKIIGGLAAAGLALALIATPAARAQDDHGHDRSGGHGGDHGGDRHGAGEHRGDQGGRGGDFHGGDRGDFHGERDHRDRPYDGPRGGGPIYHGYGGYGYGGYGGYAGPFAVGPLLGYFEGRPYYCYRGRHWRWSPYYRRYVRVPNRFC